MQTPSLEQIEKNVKGCKLCRLCETANNAVPGEGSTNSGIVFIGEAPGATEDATGRPFVGRAGKLLEGLLSEIGYKREDVWIGNIIKHRPPKNRDPFPDEIKSCQPYLKAQLETLKPKLIVTLGRFAMNYFYKEGKISLDHGTLKKIGDHYIFPVYHPAAALRRGSFAEALRNDFLKIPKVLAYIDKHGEEETETVEDVNNPQLGLKF
jgi:uracil-DNA glycosylase